MEFNNVSKTGLRTQIRQRVPEIYQFSHRNTHQLKIINVFQNLKQKIKVFVKVFVNCKILNLENIQSSLTKPHPPHNPIIYMKKKIPSDLCRYCSLELLYQSGKNEKNDYLKNNNNTWGKIISTLVLYCSISFPTMEYKKYCVQKKKVQFFYLYY